MLFMVMDLKTLKDHGTSEKQVDVGGGVWTTPGSYRSEAWTSMGSWYETRGKGARAERVRREDHGTVAQWCAGQSSEKGEGARRLEGDALSVRDLDVGIETDVQNGNEKI
jgi:hypothetical protein